MDIWAVSSFLATRNKAAMNICAQIFGPVVSFLLGKYLGVE